jgi:hypothetical protein
LLKKDFINLLEEEDICVYKRNGRDYKGKAQMLRVLRELILLSVSNRLSFDSHHGKSKQLVNFYAGEEQTEQPRANRMLENHNSASNSVSLI